MDADELARRLDVDLRSRGACHLCLYEYGREADNWFVVTLWSEGLGETVAAALAAHPEETEARRDLAARGCRSQIFRAVVRRLARELQEHESRADAAVWN